MLKTSAGITLTRATSYFDLIIVGHHPPEIDAAPFLQDLSYKGTCPRVLILREDEDLDFSPTLGAIGVVLKRDIMVVLERATNALGPMRFNVSAEKAYSARAHAWRAAS